MLNAVLQSANILHSSNKLGKKSLQYSNCIFNINSQIGYELQKEETFIGEVNIRIDIERDSECHSINPFSPRQPLSLHFLITFDFVLANLKPPGLIYYMS